MGLRITFFACLVLLAAHAFCAPFVTVSVLDDFSAVQSPVIVAIDGSAFPQSSSSAVANANILGGERDLGVSVAASAAGRVFSAGVSGGALAFAGATGATAEALLQYDGSDSSLQFDGPTSNGLENFDATLGGSATGIRLVIASDVPTTVTASIYDAAGRVSELTVAVTEPALASVYFRYAAFVGSADVSDVGAIELLMSDEGIDVTIASIDFVRPDSSSPTIDLAAAATATPAPSPTLSMSNSINGGPLPAPSTSPTPSAQTNDNSPTTDNNSSSSSSSRSSGDDEDDSSSSLGSAVAAPVALVVVLACLLLA